MNKLEKTFFYLLLITIPFNIKKFLATSGICPVNDFSGFFLYLTDLLLIGLFLFWFKRRFFLFKRLNFNKKNLIIGSLVVYLMVLGITGSSLSCNISFSFYRLSKLFLGILFFIYLKGNFRFLNFKNFLKVLFFSGILQSLIAIGQYLKQESLGLQLLGESFLAPHLSGVAKISTEQGLVMRAYGTFPHPNILATFLIISIFAGITLLLLSKNKILQRKTFLGYFVSLSLLITGLILTFSRIAIFLGITMGSILLVTAILKKERSALKYALVKLSLLLLLFLIILTIFFAHLLQERFEVDLQDQSFSLRFFYQKTALEIIRQEHKVGIGSGCFISYLKKSYPNLAYWSYQPVHNIYLLIATEMGLVSFLIFIGMIIFTLKKNIAQISLEPFKKKFSLLGIVLLLCIGFFDHFLLTINQGILLFWLLMGVAIYNKQ
jgi:O-antigen ligase